MADQLLQGKIELVYGGVANNIRRQSPEIFGSARHFDIWQDPQGLVPFRSMEFDDGIGNIDRAFQICNGFYANNNIYGLGVVLGSARVKLFKKVDGDPINNVWTEVHPSDAEDGGGSRSEDCFVEFHDYAYGGAAGNRIWGCGPLSGGMTFTSTALSVDQAPSCQAKVSRDDLLIVPCGNEIAVKNGAGSGAADNWEIRLVLPEQYTVVDHCEYGDLWIFACKPTNGVGNSKLFIWDKIQPDIIDSVDLGRGNVCLCEEIDGEIFSIINISGLSAFGIRPKLSVRTWSGGSISRVQYTLKGDQNTTFQIYGSETKTKIDSHIVFGIHMTLRGVEYHQLAAVGRQQAGYPITFSFDRLINGTGAVSIIRGAFGLGDFMFCFFDITSSDADQYAIRRTDDQENYQDTSIYESIKLNGELQDGSAARFFKQLKMAGLLLDPDSMQNNGATARLKYRIEGESDWTTIREYQGGDNLEAGDVGIGFEAGGVLTDADPVQTEDFNNYKEVELRAESTGGARITGIPYAFKVLTADVATSEA